MTGDAKTASGFRLQASVEERQERQERREPPAPDVHEQPTWPAPAPSDDDAEPQPPTVRAVPKRKRAEPEQSPPKR